jgi:hypothetical protein
VGGAIISNEVDDDIENMAHVALTLLCEHNLADTSITLFPIQNQDEPEWQQHLEAMCDPTGQHYSPNAAQMAKYARYLFNL